MPDDERPVPAGASPTSTRRQWLGNTIMGLGLAASYGFLGVQFALFLLPEKLKAATRRIFAGRADQYAPGSVQTVHDLEGNRILVQRTADGFRAYSSVCPHLGCRVHWETDKQRFFCPCHRGVFDADGKATAGPPADAGQSLARVPVELDERAGVVYIEVRNPRRKS